MTQEFDIYREYWDHFDDQSRRLPDNETDGNYISTFQESPFYQSEEGENPKEDITLKIDILIEALEAEEQKQKEMEANVIDLSTPDNVYKYMVQDLKKQSK